MILIKGYDLKQDVTIPSCIRGLRADNVLLDKDDVNSLLNMHENDIVTYLLALRNVLT